MHVKIQGGGKNAGIHANTGSCAAMVEYLQHEDKERQAEGKEVFDFFTGQGVKVSPGEVIQKIDRNHKKLCNDDAKFFHLDINLSKDEIPYLGSTDAEIVANATILCEKLTDIYAKNFNHAGISGGEDIMVFFKPHFTRHEKGDLEFHIHGIVSRKDIHNKYKLSPMSNHRSTTAGAVLGGFDRKGFALKIETAFDELFDYPRKVSDTFTYKLAMKQGTVEEKAEQEAKLSKEEVRDITTKEAEQVMPGITRTIHDSLASRDARRRNEFWNDYHSKYEPKYEFLKAACDRSFQLYKTAKERYGVTSQAISDRYTRLRLVYDEMNRCNDDVQRAKTAKGTGKAISALVFAMNPVAGILVGLVSRIVMEANVTAAIQARQALRSEAQGIKADIEMLKAEQTELRQEKSDRLRIYIENKEAKQELQNEINTLKSELTKPIEPPKPKFSFDFKAARQQAATAAPVAQNPVISTATLARSTVDISSILLSAKDKDSLDLALLAKKVVIEPIKDRFGGVSDFKVTLAAEGRVINASNLVSGDRMRQMVDKWESLTGEQPAYKLEIQREHQLKLADICAKMDAASPENAPRIPRKISYLPGREIKVSYYNSGRREEQDIMVDANGKMKFNGLILDINTGKYAQLPGQRQTPRHSQGESHGEGKGYGGRGI